MRRGSWDASLPNALKVAYFFLCPQLDHASRVRLVLPLAEAELALHISFAILEHQDGSFEYFYCEALKLNAFDFLLLCYFFLFPLSLRLLTNLSHYVWLWIVFRLLVLLAFLVFSGCRMLNYFLFFFGLRWLRTLSCSCCIVNICFLSCGNASKDL